MSHGFLGKFLLINFKTAIRSDNELCAVLLIGWVRSPESTKAWCIPRPLCESILEACESFIMGR